MLYRLGVFLGLMGLGTLIGSLEAFKSAFLAPLCALQTALSHALMHLFGSPVIRLGNELRDPLTGKAIAVLWACSGADVSFILASAILVSPGHWRARWVGALVGLLLVQAMNVLRIMSLYFLNLYSETWFEFAHLYLWQGLLMLDAVVLLLLWMRWEQTWPRVP